VVTDFGFAFDHPLIPGETVEIEPSFTTLATGDVIRFDLKLRVPNYLVQASLTPQ
jgi:hypothetical protein